jgi:hypothetical protein
MLSRAQPQSLTLFLGVMSLLFFISPIMREIGVGGVFFKMIFPTLSVSCIYLVSHKKSQATIALVLSVPGIVMMLSSDSFVYTATEVIGLLSSIFLYTFVIYVLGSHVKARTRVDRHVISGSISIYLLLGLVWSLIYILIELIFPNSFEGIFSDKILEPKSISSVFGHLFYYSYVTLTTLGYGSIFPRTVLASAFASAEAIVGQLYIAIFVARLVSLYTAQELNKNYTEPE